MTLAQWIEKVRAARARLHVAEAEFFLLLVEGETLRDEWCGMYLSFEALLKKEELVEPSRYTRFREAIRIVDPQLTYKIGVDGVIGAARASSPEKRENVIVSLEQWVKEHDGVHPSRETVERQVQLIAPTERKPNTLKRAEANDKLGREVAALRRENERLKTVAVAAKPDSEIDVLRKENSLLKAENKRLRAENEKLRSALSASNDVGPQSRPAPLKTNKTSRQKPQASA